MSGDGHGKKKKAKVKSRLTPKSRQKLARLREEANNEAIQPPLPPSMPFGTALALQLKDQQEQEGWSVRGAAIRRKERITLPPLPPPLLPDPPTLAPTARVQPPLAKLAASIELTPTEEGMLLIILMLTLLLCALTVSRVRKALGSCASEETKMRRNGERLSRISDVARSINATLDSTLERTNALSEKYESATWEAWGTAETRAIRDD